MLLALGARKPSHATTLLHRLRCTVRDGQNEGCPVGQPVEHDRTKHCQLTGLISELQCVLCTTETYFLVLLRLISGLKDLNYWKFEKV